MSDTHLESVRLLTLKEAADRLAISKRSLEREIASGRFPKPVKIGGRSVRVSLDTLRSYIVSLSGGATA